MGTETEKAEVQVQLMYKGREEFPDYFSPTHLANAAHKCTLCQELPDAWRSHCFLVAVLTNMYYILTEQELYAKKCACSISHANSEYMM